MFSPPFTPSTPLILFLTLSCYHPFSKFYSPYHVKVLILVTQLMIYYSVWQCQKLIYVMLLENETLKFRNSLLYRPHLLALNISPKFIHSYSYSWWRKEGIRSIHQYICAQYKHILTQNGRRKSRKVISNTFMGNKQCNTTKEILDLNGVKVISNFYLNKLI